VEIACEDSAKLSQIFSIRGAAIGDGLTKETAISFHRARTPFEEKEAFYGYLKANKLMMSGRRLAVIESDFLCRTAFNQGLPQFVWFTGC
jgi:hypothetical protein